MLKLISPIPPKQGSVIQKTSPKNKALRFKINFTIVRVKIVAKTFSYMWTEGASLDDIKIGTGGKYKPA